MTRLHLYTFALSLLVSPAGAQVYKSVDADGRVTYSSRPPAPDPTTAVEEMTIAPPPPERDRIEAENRIKRIEQNTARKQKQLKENKGSKQKSIETATKELDQARLALVEAKIKGDSDWQYLRTGGRVLKQSYLDRVARAQRAVKVSEEALRKAHRKP